MPPRLPLPSHIGGRGDGVGKVLYTHNTKEVEYNVFVPASLPGEDIIAQPLSISKQGIKARILELNITAPSPSLLRSIQNVVVAAFNIGHRKN